MQRRLKAVPSFAATIPMVADAAPVPTAVAVADRSVAAAKRSLQQRLARFCLLLEQAPPAAARLPRMHRRWVYLRDQFDELLTMVDVFADALTQRAEHGTGARLRGLDRLAVDGLRTRWPLYQAPPLVCYLDAGLGGAIRRAFTRLPDGSANGVALIKVPRERLFSAALASLLHEVGHQGAALLQLVPAYRAAVWSAAAGGRLDVGQAEFWAGKLSEVLPDVWALCKLGPAASIGLFATFGRAPRFTFHDQATAPHPMPWLRAVLSVRLGRQLLPDPIWDELEALWTTLYPVERAHPPARALLARIAPSLPVVIDLLASLRPPRLGGGTLAEALGAGQVHPRVLPQPTDETWGAGQPPCVAVAAIGLARYRGLIRPEQEHDLIQRALTGPAPGNRQPLDEPAAGQPARIHPRPCTRAA